MSDQARFVVKWYTRAARVRIVIAKFDGRWTLPGGPYPIPELIALVGGLLATLFALPHSGQPMLAGLTGLAGTALAVGVMRKMPYSPVPFPIRAHRLARLYTAPVSVSSGTDMRSVARVSVVRPVVRFLDDEPAPVYPPQAARGQLGGGDVELLTAGLFDNTASPAAALFG
jgi:hypothetical protein